MSLARRQRTGLPDAALELITRVTGFHPQSEHFNSCADYVGLHLFNINGIGSVRNKSVDHDAIDKRIVGLVEKFSIKGQGAKAMALQDYQKRLRRLARSLGGGDSARTIAASSEMDQDEAAQNVVSSVLLVMLELSQTPTMLRRGEDAYETPEALKETSAAFKSQDQINKERWEAILKEDPLIGEHWHGVGESAPDSEGSDYEDMDLDPRAVPATKSAPSGPTDNVASSEQGGRLFELGEQNLWMKESAHASQNRQQLRTLAQEQYWRYNQVVDKRTAVETESLDGGYDIQCSTELSIALRNSRDYVLVQDIPIMDEVDIIQEVFLLLQGLPTVIFTLDDDSLKNYTCRVSVTHLSPGALQKILRSFMDTASEMMELQSLVDSILSASVLPHGKVVQTFAAAIHSELLMIKQFLAEKQQIYQRYRKSYKQRMASLIELHTVLSEHVQVVPTLLGFIKGCLFYNSSSNAREHDCSYSTDVLSRLYNDIYQLELMGDFRNTALFQRLLKQCIRPFLLNLETWMSGQPLDSKNEFLIQATQDVDLFSYNFWSEGYYIQTDIVDQIEGEKNGTATARIVPQFLSDTSLKQIMYIGKAIRIIHTLQSPEDIAVHQSPSFASTVFHRIFRKDATTGILPNGSPSTGILDRAFPNYTHIVAHQYPMTSTLPLSAQCSSNTPPHTADYTLEFDFAWRLEQELAKAIEEQYQTTNSLLKSMQFTRSRLLWHLKGMSEFYFMMQGEVMHSFSTSIFNMMRRRRPWHDSYVLGSTFNQVALVCDWKHEKFIKIRIHDQDGKKIPRVLLSGLKVQALEQIQFEYLLPWPLAGIIYGTENTKQMYGRITTLLFQVKIVKHVMEMSSFFKAKPASSPELRLFWTLRLRLMSTINDLWSYLMMTVLNVQIQRFHAEIEGQGDLDDIIQLSQRFIHVCFERCFLKERAAPLRRSFMTILNLGLEFSALFSSFLQEQKILRQRQQQGALGTSGVIIERETRQSGRRVSFGASRSVGILSTYRRHDGDNIDGSACSDSDDGISEIEEENGDLDNPEMEEDEDIDMDDAMDIRNRKSVKKQKTGLDFTEFPRVDLQDEYDSEYTRSTTTTRKRSTSQSRRPRSTAGRQGRKLHAGYRKELEAIEHELNRCREFLVKSLRVVVNSNAARGYAARRAGGGGLRTSLGGQGDGDSDYLDGLILALSS
ncbi:hypothetical protein BGZ51_005705 [Haplosporangium sp. Z 767]|nr:hypothetical protein BGZ51_005705 [Haplosporangium sp. Z 767]